MTGLSPAQQFTRSRRDTGHLRVVAADGDDSIDVVICCADEAVAAVLESFAALVVERMRPRAVRGIEHGTRALTEAIARAEGPTLFVLCVGPHIDGAHTHALVEAFAGRRGVLHRLLVVEYDRERPEAFVGSLRRGAEGLRRQLSPDRSPIDSMLHSGRSSTVQGVAEVKGPVVTPLPRKAEVVVSEVLRDEVGTIPQHVAPLPGLERSLPRLQVVEEPEPACDPAAETAQLSRAEIVEPPKRRRWIAAAAAGIGGVLALALMVIPTEDVLTPPSTMTVGLSRIELREPEPEPEPEPDAEPTPRAAPQPDPLEDAVAAGYLRRLDLLLVAPPSARAVTWRAAAGCCRRLLIEGVAGWRLPTANELRGLWRHQMVPDGEIWSISSATKAPVPSNFVWSSGRRRLVVRPKHERAHALCVQRAPSGFPPEP